MANRFFPVKEPRAGMPFSFKGLARGIRKMANALARLEVVGGHVEWNAFDEPKIIIDPAPVMEPSGGYVNVDPALDEQSLNFNDARAAQIRNFDVTDNTVTIDLEKPPENAEFLMRVTNEDGATIGYFKVEPKHEPEEPEEPKPPPCGHPGNESGAGTEGAADGEDGGEDDG